MNDQLPPEHQQRMEQGTYAILWAVILSGLALLALYALPDFGPWMEQGFQSEVVNYGRN